MPLKPVLGVYVKVPSLLTTTVPLPGSVVLLQLCWLVEPSPRLSLPFNVSLTAVPDGVVKLSLRATGTLFDDGVTPLMVIVTVAVDVSPSLSVMV